MSSGRGRAWATGGALAVAVGALAGAAGIDVAAVGNAEAAAQGDRPYPVYTADHLARTMETLGPNFGAAAQAVEAADWGTAKERFIRAREQLATTITFWRDHERDDAVALVREALRGMDDLDTVLSGDPVDGTRARGLATEVRSRCASCHDTYRERDAETGELRLRTSAIG